MGESNVMAYCRFCEDRHRPRFLCDPAKRVLEALQARGMEFDMPTVDFPEPIAARDMGIGLDAGDVMLRQVVVMSGAVEVGGTFHPVVIFTGRDEQARPLPRWLYAADEQDMARLRELVNSRIDVAVREARKRRLGQ